MAEVDVEDDRRGRGVLVEGAQDGGPLLLAVVRALLVGAFPSPGTLGWAGAPGPGGRVLDGLQAVLVAQLREAPLVHVGEDGGQARGG
ncbi:MAG TPA: hypothetical protein VKB69_11300 [Micromonosporaceae bacterium]|nr:hypothetical protein [Micromonosporaceae bacterium]